ncbi:alpha-galactosidase [Sphingobacterium endophyticum]|uniref:hypothetical protein n=1 Tax=Sphingobacterium endophyticum TaxID=2546448 RepID=UPI0012E26BBE|nr:hypothetical protein [Sphingobacterium endophyticum]
MIRELIALSLFLISSIQIYGQNKQETFYLTNTRLDFNLEEGTYSLGFGNGLTMKDLCATIVLDQYDTLNSMQFNKHFVQVKDYSDKMGEGKIITYQHEDDNGLILKNNFIQYKNENFIMIQLEVSHIKNEVLESNYLSPLSSKTFPNSKIQFGSEKPILVDFPFDNDNWLELLALPWPKDHENPIYGVSHEIFMIYDQNSMKGFVLGSLEHDFWKTGIQYKTDFKKGELNEFIVYSGASRPDNPNLPPNFGGLDGTHDLIAHGKMKSRVLKSALIFIDASSDFRKSAQLFGKTQSKHVGILKWHHSTPFYWNSFPIESVLGHESIMMPKDVYAIVDSLKKFKNLNKIGQTYLSIDSYDQNIYSTEVLKRIGDYVRKNGQELGFYVTPFSLWTWSNQIQTAKLLGTDVPLKEVILRDHGGKPIPFKKGDWGAFPLDPTHPATKQSMISQIMKAKAIGAKLIKVDFVTAGSLESSSWYNPEVRSGMHAYDYGMKLFKNLVDSIMGDDVFLTLAISPMFPHQYAHTRFVSTDVHSHLRNSQPGFTHYGSTASSMITASHMGWIQGTLWPYTNMDAIVMRRFQKNLDLKESEIKARIISLITLGSILGDGTDFRDQLSNERAIKYLNNERITDFFKNPRAFVPLKLSEGISMDQQLTFYRSGEKLLLAALNFHDNNEFEASFDLKELGVFGKDLTVIDCFTGEEVAKINKMDKIFKIKISGGESVLLEVK